MDRNVRGRTLEDRNMADYDTWKQNSAHLYCQGAE